MTRVTTKMLAIFVAILAWTTCVAVQAPAQTGEQTVEGRIASVDPSRTEITLTDGTKLVTPQGATFKPGAITEGMIIVASYKEENGAKVLTGMAVKDRGPATR